MNVNDDFINEAFLSKEELARYSRHLLLKEFGEVSQLKLKSAKVLVIGSGGLGSPVLLYLAAAGVGQIGIVDFDVVDDSNLQRQVLFTIQDIGKPKVIAAKERLEQLNPFIKIIPHNEQLSSKNALSLFANYDVIVDGTDNFPTRYLVNDACVISGKPNVYASIFQFEGQVAVFNLTDKEGNTGPNYRDVYPTPPAPGSVPSCSEGGVLGVLPAIIGSLQANETIKVITGIGETLSGRLHIFNALSFQSTTLKIKKNSHLAPITQLIDYDLFCGINTSQEMEKIQEITATELEQWMNENKNFQLVDVRENDEYSAANIGALHIPLATVLERSEEIAKDKPVVIHCKMGGRSARAIEALQAQGFSNLYNLKGGITAIMNETKIVIQGAQ